METSRQKQKNMDLLSAVEHIVDKAKDSQLSSEFYRKADKYIKYALSNTENQLRKNFEKALA